MPERKPSRQTELGRVVSLWRYPVAGLQGEEVERSDMLEEGIAWDRAYIILDVETNSVIDTVKLAHSWGETMGLPGLLEFRAMYSSSHSGNDAPEVSIEIPSGAIVSSGDPEFEPMISQALRRKVKLVRFPMLAQARISTGRTVHLLTESSLSKLKEIYPRGDFDVRRFRPNIVISTPTSDGFVEERWVGSTISIGNEVRLSVEKPNSRCKVTTMKQGALPEDLGILATIARNNTNNLGVLCRVLRTGVVRRGDTVVQMPHEDLEEMPKPQ